MYPWYTTLATSVNGTYMNRQYDYSICCAYVGEVGICVHEFNVYE